MAADAPASNGINAVATMHNHSFLGDKTAKFPRRKPGLI
jgi:hypothetical protein